MGLEEIGKRKLKFKKTTLILFAVLVLASSLRFYNLAEKAPGIDEDFQLRVSSESWGEVIRIYQEEESNPPLQTFLGKIFFDFGGDYYFVRLLSVIAGIGAILLTFLFTKKLFNEKIALTAIFLLTLNPFHVFFSQHTRSYSFFIFTFSLVLLIFFRFIRNPNKKNSIYLGVANALMFYTHYVGLIVIFIEALYFFGEWLQKEKTKAKLKQVSVPIIISLILILPWGLVLLTHLGLQSSGGTYEHSIQSYPYVLFKFAVGADLSFLNETMPLILYAGILSLAIFGFGVWKLQKNKFFRPMALLFLLPFPLIGLTSIAVPAILWPRNFSFLLPLFAAITAFGFTEIKNKNLRTLLIALLALGWLAIIFLYYSVSLQAGWNEFIGL